MSTSKDSASSLAVFESEYVRLISQLDLVLKGLKDLWMDARDPKDKATWMERINASLDERLRLMRCRDVAKTVILPPSTPSPAIPPNP